MKCRFCNPDKNNKTYWEENGFYGYACYECGNGKTAIIAKIDHAEHLTETEIVTLKNLITKYHPNMEPMGGPNRHMIFHHFYELMIKVREG